MKINSKGSVTFSIRSTDTDLHKFIGSLPDGTGSDILRALIRDGLAYQALSKDGQVGPSHLDMLCMIRRMDPSEIVDSYLKENPVKPVKKKSTSSTRTRKATQRGKPKSNRQTTKKTEPAVETHTVQEEPTVITEPVAEAVPEVEVLPAQKVEKLENDEKPVENDEILFSKKDLSTDDGLEKQKVDNDPFMSHGNYV